MSLSFQQQAELSTAMDLVLSGFERVAELKGTTVKEEMTDALKAITDLETEGREDNDPEMDKLYFGEAVAEATE